ncbi:EcsC family protein [Luteimonas sp. SJ-92]|uniref:EcsC family protein n=1 Tax=Luteimonas salinisoli TaxID=2752307 RepID=A0A853J951_9GAMM|nr:EcsC family protein [Luteimonas salinisoli]NZA25217.1 EcsC family protein [Luteimonas salinisoli]
MHALVPLLSESDLHDLRRARGMLESPGLAAQLANAVGAPMEYVFARRLPAPVTRLINSTTRKALEQSLRLATATLDADARNQPARSGVHAAAVATTGALGGAFGLFGLVLELPVTTTVILRSIADIARSEGEDLADPGATLACFEVLTMGGRSPRDDGAESGYFAARAVLAQQVAAAAEYIAAHGLVSNGAPAIVQLLAAIASRFSINVTKKVAVQSVPVIGAVSGATLNTLFMRHFQRMARGHFTVRRLERRVGAAAVREAYLALEPEDAAAA